MQRKRFTPRDNYKKINEDLGFDFQVMYEKPYWVEDVGYEFTEAEIDKLETATNELHQMCFAAIDYVIQKDKFDLFGISPKLIPYIKKSWEREDWSMFGRFDLFFDGKKIKMFEYNADTPTSFLEASLVQHQWKEGQKLPDQFNSIDEKLVAWWEAYLEENEPKKVYFTTVKENTEDFRTTEYIMDAATRAGVETDFIFIEDIGSDGEYLYDLENNPIEHLFKLYPWEWLAQEDFIEAILNDQCQIIEPAWKMLLSNKALLAILWELYPNHEYLLPTYFSPDKLGNNYVKKPLLSREGQNVEIVKDSKLVDHKDGLYRSEKNVYQQVCILPKFEDNFMVVGSWIVGEESAGIGIREDNSQITANLSRFVPHYFGEVEEKKTVSNSKSRIAPTKTVLSEPEEVSTASIGVYILGVFIFLVGLFFIIKNHNSEVVQENVLIEKYNQDQKAALSQILSDDKYQQSVNWVKSRIDSENQTVFLGFLMGMRKMVVAGINNNQAQFEEIDKGLLKSVYCIQGEKDVSLFEEFSENIIFETEMEKKVLVGFKKKFDYYSKKVTPPTEEEIVELCKFKNFEKDFVKYTQEQDRVSTDPKNKVISEEINE